MMKSRVLQRLRAGEVVRAVNMSRVTDPWLAEVIAWSGFDCIWFDMEHRAFGYQAIDPIALACRAGSIDLMVRIRKTGYNAPMGVLEFGANGIMVPHCRSAAEARQFVEWTRFPPLGRRGFDGAGADARYATADPLEYIEQANREVFLALQVEDREAVDAIDEIVAVEGFDLLFIGPADLSISYGVPMQTDHEQVRAAIRKVARATSRAGKWWGIPAGTPETAQQMIDEGARLVACGSDHMLLVSGFRDLSRRFGDVRVHRAGGGE
jgi:4-hydroxy-2-oxoheptanedioate aldolase